MRGRAAVLAFGLALVPAAAWREVCVIGAKHLPYTDQLPKDPAPDPWVKVEVDGEELCHSEYIPNKQNPLWKRVKQNGQYSEPACCQVSESQADGYFWFSVFDAENVKWYGDYLGSSGFRLADVEGTFDLELEIDGKVPLDSTGKPSLLTVSVAANPPPPLPPLPPPPPPPPPARRFICVQSAIDLPDADFFPLSGNDLKPDAWAKASDAHTLFLSRPRREPPCCCLAAAPPPPPAHRAAHPPAAWRREGVTPASAPPPPPAGDSGRQAE